MTPRELAAYIAEHDGGTFVLGGDPTASTLEPVEYTDGYAVGLAVGTAATLDRRATPETVARTLRNVMREFEAAHVGAWVDDGRVHIDPVRVLTDRDLALRVARERGQRAIYSFATGEVIELA